MLALQLEPLYAAEAKRKHDANGGDKKSDEYRESASQNSDAPKVRTDEQLAKLAGTSRDTIRKDFGDIQELADDIRENGLINPPVVNKEYVLLAGERRLRACKLLGWPQIEVRMMGTRDAEHELRIEITENELRKEFTWTERLEYARQLERIESVKAQERITLGVNNPQGSENGKTREKVAHALGIGDKTLRQARVISDNRDLLDPSEFAEWDEGRLSTNKAYQRIGEILRELPTGHGNRFSDTSETLKADAIKEAGIPRSQAYDLQAMAANPDVVQAVLDKAEAPILLTPTTS